MKTWLIYSPNHLWRLSSSVLSNCWDLSCSDGSKDSCNSRGRYLSAIIRHLIILIILFYFIFWDHITIFGHSLYVGHENHLTSHLPFYKAEMWVITNIIFIIFLLKYLVDIKSSSCCTKFLHRWMVVSTWNLKCSLQNTPFSGTIHGQATSHSLFSSNLCSIFPFSIFVSEHFIFHLIAAVFKKGGLTICPSTPFFSVCLKS